MLSLFTGLILKFVLPTLGTALSGLVLRLLAQQLKRVNISLSADQEERVKQLVKDAVMQVEEIARRTPMSSPQKQQMAEEIVAAKLPKLLPAEMRSTIDAVLPEVRRQLTPSNPATFGR